MAAVLFDKYFVLDTLGTGGTGRVLLTEHIYLGVKRAIKVIDKGNIMKESFYSEATILKTLRHSGIPVIYDIEEDESGYYIIEEYIEGESMVSYFNHNTCDEGRILDLAIQICSILEYVHKSIVHLDIKPQNLLIAMRKDDNNKGTCRDSHGSEVYLVDFGSSMRIEDGYRKYRMGTYIYSSPEQKNGYDTDIRSDIYSFGMILEYMYTQCNVQIGRFMRNVIDRCVFEDKDMRFSSIRPVYNCLMQRRTSISNQIGLSQDVLKIYVAGTRAGIGVTHFSLMLSNWLCSHGVDAAYVEKNCSGDGRAIYKGEGRKCPVVANMGDVICEDMDYAVEIHDVGSVENIIKKQTESDTHNTHSGLIIVIAGGKIWEIEDTFTYIKDLQEVLEYNNTPMTIVFNFLDDKQYNNIRKQCDFVSYNMPYVCNPYENVLCEEFMMNLINSYIPELLSGNKRGTIFGKNDSKKIFRFIR